MYNRRLYERININVECVLFLEAGKIMEVNAILRDISESGIGLLVTDRIGLEGVLQNGLNLKFQFEDEFRVFGELSAHIVTSSARVVRIQETEEGVLIGCEILQPDRVENYVRERKIAAYMNMMDKSFDT